jgi:hypothetical protein
VAGVIGSWRISVAGPYETIIEASESFCSDRVFSQGSGLVVLVMAEIFW